MNEICKNIDVFDGQYQISNFGSVRSIRSVSGVEKIIIRKHGIDRYGYPRISLLKKGSKTLHTTIHRLVAKYFLPNNDEKNTINHINGIKTDNTIYNLEWATMSENISHAFRTGLKTTPRGEKNPQSKLTSIEVDEIKKMKYTQSRIASIYNISQAQVSNIKTGKQWNINI